MKLNVFVLAVVVLGLSASRDAYSAADPVDASASVPGALYKSPFSDYRPLGADKRIPWKAANDEVGRIGGWRAYAREAAAAVTSTDKPTVTSAPGLPAKPETAPVKPPHTGHAGHMKQGEPKKELP